jgi:protein O-GlcNAc transferase
MPTVSELLASAVAHQQAGRLQQAAEICRQQLAIEPKTAPAWHLLGVIAYQVGDYVTAAERIGRAVELSPGTAGAHSNLGLALHGLRRLDEALASFRRAVELKPDSAEAQSNLGNVLKDLGRAEEAIECYRRSLEIEPGNARTHSNLLTTLLLCPGVSAAEICGEHRRWDEMHARQFRHGIQPHENERTAKRRLRIGYLSPDFRVHCQAFFMVPLLGAHDRQQVEVCCYADVMRPDGMTNRLRGNADFWRNVAGQSDEEVARLIREDGIDVLVDLTMHMEGSRPLVFARKPAPVQVCWLAYPGTTGLSAMDYRLTDPYLDPAGKHDEFYSERSMRLAETFWCYDPLVTEPEVNSLPALRNGYVTFGSLNNFAKMNEGVLKLWAGVMRAVERSRLVLLAEADSARARVLEVLKREGIAAERVTFVGRQPMARYMEQYHQIDIGFDTLPYCGHTTSLDALWMGVPVVTLVGETVVGRAGLSQLSNLGLTELVARSEAEYVQAVAKLAGDLGRLSELRQSLRQRMQGSPLMDAARIARGIEAEYRRMWELWCG